MEEVERALDVGLIVIKNGGSTATAERAFQNILKGYKVEGVSATWRLDFVGATCSSEGHASTVLRPVGPVGGNLLRVSEAMALSERVAKGEIATDAIASEVGRINSLAPPHNRWVMIAIAACSGAFYSKHMGGDWGAFGIVFVAAGFGQFLRSLLQARQMAVAPVTLICGVLSACIAGIGLRMGLSQTVPATAIGAVIYMVPGMPLINGFIDMATHKYLFVGLERMANAAFLFLILTIAIAIANAFVM